MGINFNSYMNITHQNKFQTLGRAKYFRRRKIVVRTE